MLNDLLNIIVVGSRGSQKDFDRITKSLVPPQTYAKPVNSKTIKDLQRRLNKGKKNGKR